MSALQKHIDILSNLDQSQLAFCQYKDDAIRLLAPAGSGKTHSLLARCLWLVQHSELTKPRLLLFTFTRAARDELRKRMCEKPFSEAQSNLLITTLNSYGFKIVRKNLYNPHLIASKKDQYFAMQNTLRPVWNNYPILKNLLTDTKKRNKSGEALFAISDTLKSLGFRHDRLDSFEEFSTQFEHLAQIGMGQILAKEVLEKLSELKIIQNIEKSDIGLFYRFETLPQREIARLRNYQRDMFENYIPFWKESNRHLFNQASITLEDQKYLAYIELDKQLSNQQFTTGAGRFQHILVDEFQDINPLDLALLRTIADVNKAKITIAGDDDQAIFEWRGATPSFILYPDDHIKPPYATYILSTNYRSPRNIVLLSKKLIEHNRNRVQKDFSASSHKDAHVEVVEKDSVSSAIEYTTTLVNNLLNDGMRVALISRKRSQLIPYQITFASQKIPFCAAEDLQVFLSEAFNELKDMLKIRDMANVQKNSYYDPVIDLLKLCDKVKRYPLNKEDKASLLNYLKQNSPQTLMESCALLRKYQGTLKGENADARMSNIFADAIQEFIESPSVTKTIQAIGDCFDGLQKDYGKSIEDIFYTDPPFIYLAELAQSYEANYRRFIEDIDNAITTLQNQSSEDDGDYSYDACWQRKLHLMTALRAKGKEFDAVIILDVNQGIWPIKHAETERQLEQERRLFYVAMTRAKKYLYFIVNDTILDTPTEISPYLGEMGLI